MEDIHEKAGHDTRRHTVVQRLVWAVLILSLTGIRLLDLSPPVAAYEATVTPPIAMPGTIFHFTAAGYIADEEVNYWIDVPDGRVFGDLDYEVEADDSGQAAWSWRAPANAVAGIWYMVARGRESGVEHAIAFEIDPNPGAYPDAPGDPGGDLDGQNVEPRIGTPGTEFAFYATGFVGNEWVGIWLNTPDGGVVSSPDLGNYAYNGRVDWSWQSPTGALRGTWQMVARGEESGVVRILTFEIR
jgi:hypothetical protein